MARTRGATKNAVDDSADIPVPDQNPAGEDSLAMEKSAPKPKRTRSRRGKRAVEGQQETDEQEALNWDTVTAEAEEESEAEEGVGEHEEQSGRSKSRAGKTRGQEDKEILVHSCFELTHDSCSAISIFPIDYR